MKIVSIGLGAFILSCLATATPALADRVQFPICGNGKRITCVVDGDTIWLRGTKIRLEGIDTPEIGGARCEDELARGVRAQRRLQALLNAGDFVLIRAGNRDRDRYGRKLRTMRIRGADVAETLISEGLAKRWTGTKAVWCPRNSTD
ncbi:thermonuclease family protein [Corticibacterium sp. UT-5YL-CI-8]|nr:thermonuclease family protein [Tianweitania sp. UT-5YL-CI-8]